MISRDGFVVSDGLARCSRSLEGNEKALSTVTAIIDGTGSVGAALGPLLTGFLAEQSWDHVFYMLYGAAICSGKGQSCRLERTFSWLFRAGLSRQCVR